VIYHPSVSGHSTEEEETDAHTTETADPTATVATTSTTCTVTAATESSPAKDECFPELALHHTSSSGSPENDSCGCEPVSGTNVTPREGGAFPKAFERDLVTPTHLLDTSEDKIYDSGIDMRDVPVPTPPANTAGEEPSTSGAAVTRKKASSVSFCSEPDKEIMPASSGSSTSGDVATNLAVLDKNAAAESKKAKVTTFI
jgi:hypothetical protein